MEFLPVFCSCFKLWFVWFVLISIDKRLPQRSQSDRLMRKRARLLIFMILIKRRAIQQKLLIYQAIGGQPIHLESFRKLERHRLQTIHNLHNNWRIIKNILKFWQKLDLFPQILIGFLRRIFKHFDFISVLLLFWSSLIWNLHFLYQEPHSFVIKGSEIIIL